MFTGCRNPFLFFFCVSSPSFRYLVQFLSPTSDAFLTFQALFIYLAAVVAPLFLWWLTLLLLCCGTTISLTTDTAITIRDRCHSSHRISIRVQFLNFYFELLILYSKNFFTRSKGLSPYPESSFFLIW